MKINIGRKFGKTLLETVWRFAKLTENPHFQRKKSASSSRSKSGGGGNGAEVRAVVMHASPEVSSSPTLRKRSLVPLIRKDQSLFQNALLQIKKTGPLRKTLLLAPGTKRFLKTMQRSQSK